MTDSVSHAALFEANTWIIQRHFNGDRAVVTSESLRLYLDKDSGFTGFRRH